MGVLHVAGWRVEGGGREHRGGELWDGRSPAPVIVSQPAIATISQLQAFSLTLPCWSWSWCWALRLESDVSLDEILQVPDDLLDVVDVVGGLVGGEVLDHVVQPQLGVAAVREGADQPASGEAGEGGEEGGEVREGATVAQQAA